MTQIRFTLTFIATLKLILNYIQHPQKKKSGPLHGGCTKAWVYIYHFWW